MADNTRKSVLVLNSCFEPLNLCSARRALVMIMNGKAKVEEIRSEKIHTTKMWDEETGDYVTVDTFLPSVIRLLRYRYLPKIMQSPTRKNIFSRDMYCCMYCGEALTYRQLTLDHVVPRCKGGKDTWENMVASCLPCNKRKANKLLHEIPDMKLLRTPRPMTIHTSRQLLRNQSAADPLWRKYLFFEQNNINTWSEHA